VVGLGLIASQALADSPERRLGRYREAEDTEKNGIGKIVDGLTPKLSSDGNVRELVHAIIVQQSRRGISGALEAMAEREDSTQFLISAKIPLVIVHGDADMLIPVKNARTLNSLVPDSYFVEMKNTGHMPMLEAPRDTAVALMTFK
jgi:pimeloyl-ACP methyl ester carboxylesterase